MTTKNDKAREELETLVTSFTMRDWMLARTRLDMNREEIAGDDLAIMVMAAWKKAGSNPMDFDKYLDKGQLEIMTELGFDLDEVKAEAEADEDDAE